MSEQGGDVRIRVGGVLLSSDGVLLIAHKKNDEIYWLLPGGGVDYGESLSESLVREFMEELNIEVTVSDLAFISDSIDPTGERHVVNICFICKYSGGEYLLGSEGILHDFSFFKIEEIPDLKIFPPINAELITIMNNGVSGKYIGKLWKDK